MIVQLPEIEATVPSCHLGMCWVVSGTLGSTRAHHKRQDHDDRCVYWKGCVAVALRRHGAKHLGPYFRFAVLVIEPFLTVWTRRERQNIEILAADYPPNDGIVVVVNHMSWFDPMNVCCVLWDAGRPPRFLAKDRLFNLPGIGQVLGGAGQIPVYRDSDDSASAIRAAVDAVNNGECVVIYPEGTMTRDPNYWPMKGRSGAAQLGLVTGVPIIPMAQWGPQEVIRPYETEFNLFPRKTMRTLVGQPVELDDLRGKELTKDVLDEATRRIMADITALLEELRGEKAPADALDYRDWKAAQQAAGAPPVKPAATKKATTKKAATKKATTKKAAAKKAPAKKATTKRTTSARSTKKGEIK